MCFYFLVLVRQWLIGGLVPGDWIPLWRGVLLNGTLRIPSHWAPNHQETISWACTYLESRVLVHQRFFCIFCAKIAAEERYCSEQKLLLKAWKYIHLTMSRWKKASAFTLRGGAPSHSFGEILSSVSLHKNLYRQIHSSISHRRNNFCIIFILKVCRFSRTIRIAWTKNGNVFLKTVCGHLHQRCPVLIAE